MIDAIQAVASAYAASVPPALIPRLLQSTRQANSALLVPSVILTLGATASAPLTYNAAGLYKSLSQVAAIPRDASGPTAAQELAALLAQGLKPSTADTQDLANQLLAALNSVTAGRDSTSSATSIFSAAALLQGLPPDLAVSTLIRLLPGGFALGIVPSLVRTATAAPPETQQSTAIPATPPVATAAAATRSATPVIAAAIAPAAPTGTPNVTPQAVSPGATIASANPVANSFLQDFVAQARNTIAGNPAYANVAAALYMKVVILRSQQVSEDMLNSSSRVQPVTALSGLASVQAVRRYI